MELNSQGNLNFYSEKNSNKLNTENSNNLNHINLINSKSSYDSLDHDGYDSEIIVDMKEGENMEATESIKFPDKVKMNKINSNKFVSDLPRLDMSRVVFKYKSQNNFQLAKPIKKIENNININKNVENKLLNQKSIKNKINKKEEVIIMNNKIKEMNLELIQTNDMIKDLDENLEKSKKAYKENKTRQTKMRENLKIADSKIENFKIQLKTFLNKEIGIDENLNVIFFSKFLGNFFF